MGATRALIESVRSLRYDDLPEEAREVARHCVLDFIGCALAGSREPLVSILVKEVARPERSSEARLVGLETTASRTTAALVNGAAGHALDFDDTHLMMNGHPSVPVLPALLAAAESEPSDGRRFVTALVAGIELECRLGALIGTRHYDVGFHATGTLGTFGAAAACAHLFGLDEAGWMNALGLAGTEAAGLKSGFGTMAKPLHAGRAASAGLLAALAARGGFVAAADGREIKQGFAETHAGEKLDETRLERWRGRFVVRDTLFKYHAACYLTHAAIDTARRLRDEHAIDPATIESVAVTVSPRLLGVCDIPEPRTGLEGKFSLRATTAMALLGADTSTLAAFDDAVVADPRLIALRDKIRVATDPALVPTHARVTVVAGSRERAGESDSGVPASDLRDQRRRLRAKFTALAAPVVGERRAAEAADVALDVDGLEDARDLLRAVLPVTR
jgi:2-methylcitrate dehydratase PrpD